MNYRLVRDLFLVLGTVAVLHYIAMTLKIYDYATGFDKIVHCLAGVSIALAYFTLRRYFIHLESYTNTFITMVGAIFVVAVLWEIFEFCFDLALYVDGYWLDTIPDVVVALVGGSLTYLYVSKKYGINS